MKFFATPFSWVEISLHVECQHFELPRSGRFKVLQKTSLFIYIICLTKWAWAKLYKTVHSFVYMISCLNCTVQLTDTSIVNNLIRPFMLPAHILLLELRVMGKIWKLLSYMILQHETDLVLHEVHGKMTKMA